MSDALKAAGNAFLSAGKFDEAIDAYTNAIEIEKNHILFSNRSAAYLSKNEPELALQDAITCIELNPTWAKGFSRKGAALHAMKKYEAATEAYETGLEIAPSDEGLKNGLAEVQKANSSGGLFGPAMMNKLRGNPKFASRLNDPTFLVTLILTQLRNPYLTL